MTNFATSSNLTRLALLASALVLLAVAISLRRSETPPETVHTGDLPAPSEYGPPLRDALQGAVSRVLKSPEDGDAWGRLGMRCQAHDLLPEARHAYRAAAELAPEDARWPALLGLVCEISSLTDQSIQAYTLALEKNPKDLAVLCSLARIEQDRGNDDLARERYLQALEIDKRCVAAHIGLGQVAARSGSDEMAIEHLDIALQGFPYSSMAHAELARIYSRRGDVTRSRFHERWSRVGRKTPIPNPLMADVSELGVTYAARMERAKNAISQARWTQAIEHLEAAAELQIDLAEPPYTMSIPLIRLGRIDAAIESLKKATTLKGQARRIDAWLRLAALLASSGRWEEAFAAIDAVDELSPQHPRGLVEKGRLHRRRGEHDLALAAFEQCIATHPEAAEAYLEKGKHLLQAVSTGAVPAPEDRDNARDRIETALSLFETALELQADLAGAYEFAAEARMHLRLHTENPDEKTALLREALELYADHVFYFPQRKKGYEKLARALLTAGNRKAAREVITEALKRWPGDQVLRRLLGGS